ncbi:Crp/Fnr family transcriptional regulator [Franzmannia qiaohouensis]|uniref:Crp/Fnr family transcriptional regulator n=1 Tax=Franzmannia qiaohouensis TaxID=1329370 RepID=A0ABU1HDM8_9GAMM|nr:Crp/Fnr family transcriptional regulator [Halomonas qiaohouensis]MDR5905397.1 Crp/Fnr family transcriptional regulator [Halomonas qiaohouensis]
MDERKPDDGRADELESLKRHSDAYSAGMTGASHRPSLPFSHFIDAYARLLDELSRQLSELTSHVINAGKGHVVQRYSDTDKQLYLLEEGWACSKRYTRDSNIQRLELYVPDDIMGVRELASLSVVSEISMLTPGRIRVFSGEQVNQAYETSAALRVVFLRYLAVRGNLVLDRLKSCVSVDAPTRIIYLILETHTRLVNQNALVGMEFELPLTQEEIGEFLGLSAVHVSRSFSLLEEYGYLKRDRNTIKILNYQKSLDKADFYREYIYRGSEESRGEPLGAG